MTQVRLGNHVGGNKSQSARETATPNAWTDEFLTLSCVKGA